MARMIPPHLAPECTSPGERALFARFRDEQGTSGWTVLHSLGVARHPSRLAGEVDFVVLVPGEGVLCLEIKAGEVRREEGIWVYGPGGRTQISRTGPFRQAADGMHAIRRYLGQVDPALGTVLMVSAVFFTGVTFAEVSPEWFPWQIVDRAALSNRPVGECCRDILRHAHRHAASTPSARWYDPHHSRPDSHQTARIAQALRGDFECAVRPRVELEEAERQICALTEEQYMALDALEENQQVLLKGPAGTGKTFLAMEAARRSVAQGRATLLCCFNRLLGHWLDRAARDVCIACGELLTVGSFHSFLLRLARLPVSAHSDAVFWSTTLPQAVVEEALTGSVQAPLFAAVVIDEAQDLLTPEYLDVIDLLLEGGLRTGRWAMFGDLERQSIFSRPQPGGAGALQHLLRERAPHHFVFPLRVNCRNTSQIAAGLELACGLEPGYSRLLRTEMGPDIDIGFYDGVEAQKRTLLQKLRALRSAYRQDEIVVLSSREDTSSCASRVAREHPDLGLVSVRSEGTTSPGIGWATIHAFKGLEAPVVVLTDLDQLDSPNAEALLYIGMSRARYHLVVLLPERLRQPWLEKVHRGLLRQARERKS